MRPPKRSVSHGTLWSVGAILVVAGIAALISSGLGGKAAAAIAGAYDAIAPGAVTYTREGAAPQPVDEAAPEPEPAGPVAVHIPTPEHVKAVYMSQCAAGTPSFREYFKELLDTTELNSVIIDIRDYTGYIAFPSEHPLLKDFVSDECGARDMKELIESFHEKGIYVIGRITVFQNPAHTKTHPEHAVKHANGGIWKDHKGLAFVDVGATEYWDYVVALANESYAIGFDEINFDYIRYPSDGDMSTAVYIKRDGKTKQELLEDFFKYLHENVDEGMVTSADLFGMVTTNYDDLNIGQVLERALPYFDYIAPMVYPSHYPKNFNGWSNPNEVTYELMKFVMQSAIKRTVATTSSIPSMAYTRIGTSTPAVYTKPAYPKEKMRPWLQDFDYPVEYTPEMVRNQIRANEELGLHSYMFWDPANKYTSLRQVVKPE